MNGSQMCSATNFICLTTKALPETVHCRAGSKGATISSMSSSQCQHACTWYIHIQSSSEANILRAFLKTRDNIINICLQNLYLCTKPSLSRFLVHLYNKLFLSQIKGKLCYKFTLKKEF